MRRSLVVSSSSLLAAALFGFAVVAGVPAQSGAANAPDDTLENDISQSAPTEPESAPAVAATPSPPSQPPSVPEDSESLAAFDFVPRWLRDLFTSRPNEDLVVCLAGCAPHRDRVVYARLKDLPDAPPVAAAKPQDAPSFVPTVAAPGVVAPPVNVKPAAAVVPVATPAPAPSAPAAAKIDQEMPAFAPTLHIPGPAGPDAAGQPARAADEPSQPAN